MKKLNLILAILTVTLVACKKESLEPSNPGGNNTTVSKFSEIKTQESFDWSTSKVLTVQISGLKTIVPVSNTLQLTDPSGKIVYYSGLHTMDQNLEIKFSLPTATQAIQLHFGSVVKDYTLNGNTLAADYVINYPDEQ